MKRRVWILLGAAAALTAAALLQTVRVSDQRHERARETAAVDPSPGRQPRVVANPAQIPEIPAAFLAAKARSDAFGRFNSWVARFMAETDPDKRRALVAEGIEAARGRRSVLAGLIVTDPEAAVKQAIPWAMRRVLPPEVAIYLEARIDGIGQYHAIVAYTTQAAVEGFRATRRETVIDGVAYDTYVYGRRLELGSRSAIAVHGIAIDGRLALIDSPVRVLDPGEPLPAGRRIETMCAVSGKAAGPGQADAPEVSIAADTGDRIVYLCSAGHIGSLAASLEETGGEGGTAGQVADSPVAPAQGTRRVLMIRVRFADQPTWFEPETLAGAEAIFASARHFYAENSFGTLTIEGTISPIYTLPQTAAWYAANDTSGYALNVLQAARAVAADPGAAPGNAGLAPMNYLDFDFEAVRYATGPGSFAGQGYVGMRGIWIKSSEPGVLVHELGHNLGLWHANAWAPNDALVPLGDGANVEYGDDFDTMGPARGGAWHFNAWEKHRLGWLPSARVSAISGSGVYTLSAHDVGGGLSPSDAYALMVRRDADRDYWIEYRQHAGWTVGSTIRHGIGLRWDPWVSSNGGSQLIDATPGSTGGREDAALTVGRTFSDVAAGIHITPVVVHSGDSNHIDVDVRVGTFAGNLRPSVAVTATSSAAEVGQMVSFVAQSTDPDGDELSYHWDFEDGSVGSSTASTEHAWSAAGDHRARVTVSDRKGGVASAAVLVQVGAVSGSRISGRVVDLTGNPIAGVSVNNGLSTQDVRHRSAWSDADGSFTLLGVPEGSWTVDATAPGWIFAQEGFTRTVDTPGTGELVTLLGCWKGFSVAGRVLRADGTPISSALVRAGDKVEPTDVDGTFLLTGCPSGAVVLQVEAAGAAFDPVTVAVGLSNTALVVITEKTFRVAGRVLGAANLAEVTVTTGWQSTSALEYNENEGGQFVLSGVPAGSWIMRALSDEASFSRTDSTGPLNVTGELSGVVLTRDSERLYAVQGRVFDRGLALAGATVRVGERTAITDTRGGYFLGGLESGEHNIEVAAAGLAFAPALRSVFLAGSDATGQDFSTTRENLAPSFVQPPVAVAPLHRPFVLLRAEAEDEDGAALLRYSWSVGTSAPGPVDFVADDSHAARQTFARFQRPGVYPIRVTATDGLGAATTVEFPVTVGGEAAPPVITVAAHADPAVVGATLSTLLSVRASSEMGDASLSYTWKVDSPAPGPVVFSRNGNNAARDVEARFQAAGNYLMRVSVRDGSGHVAESAVAVRVDVSYGSWQRQHFPADVLADPANRETIWGEQADPDGDGLANLLEYAFGLDPWHASVAGRPVTSFVDVDGVEYLAVSFRPNPDAIDLAYQPVVSSDLDHWQGGLVLVSQPGDPVVTYRDFEPAAANTRRFIRVDVSTVP